MIKAPHHREPESKGRESNILWPSPFPFCATWVPSLQGGTCHIQSRPFPHELYLWRYPHRHAEVYPTHPVGVSYVRKKNTVAEEEDKVWLKRRCDWLVFRLNQERDRYLVDSWGAIEDAGDGAVGVAMVHRKWNEWELVNSPRT